MATDARPAQPKSILRGHKAQVHAAAFVRANERLLTADAEGFVVVWDLTIMRPRAVWQAHAGGILGVVGWGVDSVITHGRDNKLIAWKLAADDEPRLSTCLPLDSSPEPRPQPWILHMLEVNTMNFCSFAHCPAAPMLGPDSSERPEILIAVPNTLASEAIDIFHLPSQSRLHTVRLGDKNGMVMALALYFQGESLTLVAGYENGVAIVAQFDGSLRRWMPKYQAKSHSQPVLSLDISPGRDYFLTSSADSVIAKHPLPDPIPVGHGTTAAATMQGASNDNKQGTAAAAAVSNNEALSAALAQEARAAPAPAAGATTAQLQQTQVYVAATPLKVSNTKHSGQQSLRVRSDGRVFATAGWDAKIRVYSAKTLKELAVLKWHQTGCYAAAFAEIEPGAGGGDGDEEAEITETPTPPRATANPDNSSGEVQTQVQGGGRSSGTLVPKLVALTVRDKRIRQAKTAHWLAAGSKDGKVSLWDIF
ncbi:WD40-repeat-containing domain protein [Lasiosphaeria ovina]|uniref:ASTRA-associated protein 1 n=1 Tax=Lasiosphaeria ovina TaxID=92902 RepID=A0AAE0MYI5_9PEZI|nr:WD40-repeat-containing domain protein [Lasiosphaeria ovina]